MTIDLPSLTTITSEGSSFKFPRSVTLRSIISNTSVYNTRYSKSPKR